MHAVGVPYRVASSQDQDSLRVLQYVEKQLAQFNPARSTSHQCKLQPASLWIYCLKLPPGSFQACACCSSSALHSVFLDLFSLQHVLTCHSEQTFDIWKVPEFSSLLMGGKMFSQSLLQASSLTSLLCCILIILCFLFEFVNCKIHPFIILDSPPHSSDPSSLQHVRAELTPRGGRRLPPDLPTGPEESSARHPRPRASA